MAPYSFSSISPERLELRPSNFLIFSFLLLCCQKNINMLFLDFCCYHGNHFVESALTKIIKITKLCFFFSSVLVHSLFPIIIVDMLP